MNLRKTMFVLFVLGICCLSLPAVLSAEPNIQGQSITTPDSATVIKGLKEGFQNFFSHSEQGIWTMQDEQILQLLQHEIPDTLNSVRRSVLDVADTFTAQCELLARALYGNQHKYPQPRNWNAASVFAGSIALHASVATKTLDPDTLQILLMEAVKQNGNQIPERNEDVNQQFWVNLVRYAINNAK